MRPSPLGMPFYAKKNYFGLKTFQKRKLSKLGNFNFLNLNTFKKGNFLFLERSYEFEGKVQTCL